MAITDSIAALAEKAEEQPKASWVQDLVDRRYQPQNKRVKRNPVGFQFQRDPFDPSSYYNEITAYRNISKLATNVVRQKVANSEEAERQRQYEADQAALRDSLGGVNPNFTYDGGGSYNGKSRDYGLRHISPTTSRAADIFGGKYGIRTIGGFREHGSVPGSDHPKGRALDFMINNIKNGKKTGTALANDLVRNYKKYNVKYVIWNRHIWTPGRGWHKYNGPSPHTDHVHASFNK